MRVSEGIWQQQGFREAFFANERQERLRSGKVACGLVVFLMPAGLTLDLFVYPHSWAYFFQLRLLCSVLAGLLWFLHTTPFALRYYRLLGIPIAILPAFFIAWMIAVTEGPESPYYAGLILILLAVNAVVHWTTGESLLAMAMLLTLYLLACLPWTVAKAPGIFFNNVYFLVLTGIIVVIGNYLYNQLHFREFTLRFELGQNRQKLEETNQKLVELDQIKSRFFANISHELRTPLTLLLAPLESLIQERGSTLEPQMRQLLLIMRSNGMRLLKLINDLLELVRLESGKMEVKREPVAVEPFLVGLGNSVGKTAEDRGIRLETIANPNVGTALIDGDKLEKILLNLLFNALKFTPAGGKVRLAALRQNGDLVLEVSDTGMGIDDEKLPFVFDRFWQADISSQRKYQGVGIGLALVRELVEVQGGTVGVRSGVGKGTTFTVRLPYQEADGGTVALSEKEAGNPENQSKANGHPLSNGSANDDEHSWLKKLYREAELLPPMTSLRDAIRPVETSIDSSQPRALVADDEPDMLRFLKLQLSPHFQVIEAVDGQQAIDKASQFLPDVIVCDMMMPEKSGLEVCRELKQRTSTRAIPFLLLTARADEETKLTALAEGANDFLSKPFSTTELVVRMKNLVDTYHLQQELARKNQILETTIEQLKETEAQLVHSEKLASLGRMSAGIIHEINNPLNFTKTGLYTLRTLAESLEEEQQEFREILHDIEEGIDRVIGIVSDLRTFSQINVTQCEVVRVGEVVNSALRFLSSEWQNKVAVKKEIAEDQTVWANPNQLTQILVNLLQNSLDALKKKPFSGTVPTLWLEVVERDGESQILVRDNGEGIARENLNKIFDPFFTTKDVGEGMGLGLSICYRLMNQQGGRIEVRSEFGQYAEFTLHFPKKDVSKIG